MDAAKAERAALSQAVVIASAGDSPAVDRGVQLALNATRKTRGMAASASAAVLPTPKPAARPERPKSAEPDSGPFLARAGSSAMLDEDNPFGDETFREEAFGDDDGFGGAAFDGAG